MEFLIGSNLAPAQSSTPTEIRHWAAPSHNILQRNLLPESYTALSIKYPSSPLAPKASTNFHSIFTPNSSPASCIDITSNHALTSHHDDTQHFALELSQHMSPLHPSFSPSNLPPSASYAQLPQHQFVAINNQIHSYSPFTANNFFRSLSGPLLLKLGTDSEVTDIDISARFGDNIVARAYVVADHKDILDKSSIPQSELDKLAQSVSPPSQHPLSTQPVHVLQFNSHQEALEMTKLQQKHSLLNSINRKNLTLGGDLTYNAPTYSLGVKYNNCDDLAGMHISKSLRFDSTKSSLDFGMEYWIKVQDMQDTFTLGALYSQDEYHGKFHVPNIKQYLIKTKTHDDATSDARSYTKIDAICSRVSSTSSKLPSTDADLPNKSDNGTGQGFDIFTTSVLPTSLYFDVNGVGAISLGYTTSIYDAVHSYSPPALALQNSLKQPETPQSSNWSNPLSDLAVVNSTYSQSILLSILSSISPWIGLDSFSTPTTIPHHTQFFTHTAHNLATTVNYSIGSRESGLECGLQRIQHTFYKSQQPLSSSSTSSSTSSQTMSPNSSMSTNSSFYHQSTLQQTLSFSSLKGLSLHHDLEFSPPPTHSEPIQPWTLPSISTSSKKPDQSKFFLSLSLSTLLPFQLSEHFFRTHHMFPPLPQLHQPYQDIDATPCVQDPFAVHSGNDLYMQQQHPQFAITAPWYPADYTSPLPSSFSTTPTLSTDQQSIYDNIPPHYAQNHGKGKNVDDITRRLSLNTQNGEYRSISNTTATPSPIWNPYEGTKINFTFGWGVDL